MIPDVASVKEALDDFEWHLKDQTPEGADPLDDDWDHPQLYIDCHPVSTLVEAARAWVDLMERGEPVWWCEKHRLFGTDMECDENGMGQRACSMVEGLRVPLVSPSPTEGGE